MKHFRNKRLQKLLPMIKYYYEKKGYVYIADFGGSEAYWKDFMSYIIKYNVIIFIFNKTFKATKSNRFQMLAHDCCERSSFHSRFFDIVHSNSVIEHVGGKRRKRSFAREIKRSGKSYFIQTPNKNFIIEPHFMMPFFNLIPLNIKVFLLNHFNIGYFKKTKCTEKSKKIINEIKLLSYKDIEGFFYGTHIHKEKILGLTKSFIAIKKDFK